MRPRTSRQLLARGYAAVIVALRHLVPLAWIAAAVAASIALPDLASAPTSPLEDLAAKNGAASKAQARATERFGFPLATDVAVVQRDPRGLDAATVRRQLVAAQIVRERRDPALRGVRAALPIVNAGPAARDGERSTTAITYLFLAPDLALDDRVNAART
jgi:putative drug exporter of the RND superfamily